MDKLAVLLITDGRPGHFTLSEGIVAALRRLRPVEVTRMQVRRPRWCPGRVLSHLSNLGVGPDFLLHWIYGATLPTLPRIDLIVSAGGDTLAANVAAHRLTGAPNIFYGSLRRYPETDFALVLTSYARHRGRARHLVTPKPSPLDADRLMPGKDAAHDATLAGLLVGGPSGTVSYSDDDWTGLILFIEAFHRQTGRQWLISSSPRTPHGLADRLAALAGRVAGPIRRFIDYRSSGAGTLSDLFAGSAFVLVTSDSSSMLSEAIWARRKAVSISPRSAALPSDEQDYRRFLEESGWCRSMPITELTLQRLEQTLATITPISENPLDRLACDLSQSLPVLVPRGPSAPQSSR